MKRRQQNPIFRTFSRFIGLGAVAVEEESMAPTFSRGDWLIVRYITPTTEPRWAKVGRIALIERHRQPGVIFIKRIVEIRGDSPNRHYKTFWVEGDNKGSSQDSRTWGALDGEELIGRVLLRYRKAK